MYKLFYYPRNASWAPHLVLREMRVEHELILVDRKTNAQKNEDYLKLNPTGRIPTLADNDLMIFESAAICLHLCDQHPETKLIPGIGDPLRAQFYQWLLYLNSTIQPELMLYFYPQQHTTNPEMSNEIKIAQETRITDMFAILDKELEGKEFLIGHSISVCDYFLFMLAHWASGFTRAPLSFEHLGKYLRRLATRKAVQDVCRIEGTSLKDYGIK